jgi:glycosyltransferase involved in cell wall biosynthesis
MSSDYMSKNGKKIGVSLLGITESMGGNYQYAINLVRDLVKRFSADQLVFFIDSIEPDPAFNLQNIKYVKINKMPEGLLIKAARVVYGLGIYKKFGTWLKGRYEPMDLQGCSLIFYPYWSPAAFILDTPAIASIHDCAPTNFNFNMPIITRLQLYVLIKSIANKARVCLVDSEYGKNELNRIYGRSHAKIVVYAFRASDQLTFQTQKNVPKLLEAYRIQTNYFILPGRWGGYKNTERVLAAFKIAKETSRHFNFRLLLCGLRASEIPIAQRYVSSIGLTSVVDIHGMIPSEDLAVLYKNSYALIFPTLLGPTSLPIYEALQFGCPIITSNIEAYPEVVGNAALIVNPFCIAEIAQAIQKISGDIGLRNSLSLRAIERHDELKRRSESVDSIGVAIALSQY